VDNPWTNLKLDEPRFVLDCDQNFVEAHNKWARPEHKIMVDSIPEPFIGNPETARVVFLSLNPGHEDEDAVNHQRSDIRELMLNNLGHRGKQYPFYPRHPAFQGTGVQQYWDCYTKDLHKDASLDDRTFAERILIIEWFPYHSKRCSLRPGVKCESQKYNFWLASKMIATPGVEVLGLRSRGHWLREGREYSGVPFIFNRQRPWITRGNMDASVYDRLLSALTRKPTD
jgi:hypothetical protein